MTTVDEYWLELCRETPHLLNGHGCQVIMCAAGLRTVVSKAYARGRADVISEMTAEMTSGDGGGYSPVDPVASMLGKSTMSGLEHGDNGAAD